MLSQLCKNLWVNVSAYASTASLAVVSFLQSIDGILPTVSLLITATATGLLACYHVHRIVSGRKLDKLHAKKLQLEIELLKRKYDE